MIALNNVSIGYTKSLRSPLTITFNDGKMYGVLGRSGCGKSTLLRTIAKLQKPLAGTISYSDNEVVYMMHQRYTNFDWLNCLKNVLIAERNKKKRKERINEAISVLKDVGLGDYIDRYPRELSGGMQQRLSLARMLFVKPKYLLMDEPLSALDDKTREKMQNLIVKMHKETKNTVIMVTHSPEEAYKMCDVVIKLEKENLL